jgi:hypothetical protein
LGSFPHISPRPSLYTLADAHRLLGKTLSYTVDLSQVACGCNAALYTVTMPAYNKNGIPIPTINGDYYCESQASRADNQLITNLCCCLAQAMPMA